MKLRPASDAASRLPADYLERTGTGTGQAAHHAPCSSSQPRAETRVNRLVPNAPSTRLGPGVGTKNQAALTNLLRAVLRALPTAGVRALACASSNGPTDRSDSPLQSPANGSGPVRPLKRAPVKATTPSSRSSSSSTRIEVAPATRIVNPLSPPVPSKEGFNVGDPRLPPRGDHPAHTGCSKISAVTARCRINAKCDRSPADWHDSVHAPGSPSTRNGSRIHFRRSVGLSRRKRTTSRRLCSVPPSASSAQPPFSRRSSPAAASYSPASTPKALESKVYPPPVSTSCSGFSSHSRSRCRRELSARLPWLLRHLAGHGGARSWSIACAGRW